MAVNLKRLTTPQKRALAYYYRSQLPNKEKLEALRRGRSVGEPDPRTTWWLINNGLIERNSVGRQRYKLKAIATDTAKSLFEELCLRKQKVAQCT